MYWERVTEEIYLFTSDRYALVNSTAVLTQEGIVVVDALPFPNESKQIARFLEIRTGLDFHALILTHHHIDHVYGMDAFPESLDIFSSELCRDKLLETGEASLKEAKANNPAFEDVTLRYPTVTFELDQELFLHAGENTFRMFSLPGHTEDNIAAYMEEQQVLFTGDAVMAIPIIVDGDWEQAVAGLNFIKELGPETVVQGHGEVILRGEVDTVMDRYIDYLECVYQKAEEALDAGWNRKQIWDIPLEACGLERVPLGIASHRLHVGNIMSVYDQLKAE